MSFFKKKKEQNNIENHETVTSKNNKGKKKKPQSKTSKRMFRLIFLLGFLVMLYPLVNRLYYRIDSSSQVETFNSGKDELTAAEIERRIALAHSFNESLTGNIADDPYTRKKQEEGRKEYARMLEIKEMIGHVEIPRINQNLPIYAGTSEDILQKGVGHLEGTSLPVGGNNTHTVLTAHAGLPEATLFTNLNQLEVGDKFYIHNIEGILAYQVDQIKTVEPSDFSDLLVSPGHDYATLLTCTPIMINTHRLLVRGHRVPYVPAVDEELIKTNKSNWIFRILFFVALILILILFIYLMKLRRDNKKYYRHLEEIKKEQDELKKILGEDRKVNDLNNNSSDMFERLAEDDEK